MVRISKGIVKGIAALMNAEDPMRFSNQAVCVLHGLYDVNFKCPGLGICLALPRWWRGKANLIYLLCTLYLPNVHRYLGGKGCCNLRHGRTNTKYIGR